MFFTRIGLRPSQTGSWMAIRLGGRPADGQPPAAGVQAPPNKSDRLLITMDSFVKAREVILQFARYKAANPGVKFTAVYDRTPYEQNVARETQKVVNILRGSGTDARYRDTGRIAEFENGRLKRYIPNDEWPAVPA